MPMQEVKRESGGKRKRGEEERGRWRERAQSYKGREIGYKEEGVRREKWSEGGEEIHCLGGLF